ncbi:MAG: hypothetical protein MRY59_02175 [Aquisalinus sp.]|nr:hypothetical protein [Aquisalinus sp.]
MKKPSNTTWIRKLRIAPFCCVIGLACLLTPSAIASNTEAEQIETIEVGWGSDLHVVQADVRQAQAANPGAQIIVKLANGRYKLRSPLEFNAEDSGTASKPVIWRNAPGARPVISGGRFITNWQDEGNGIVSAQVPSNAVFRQLYVNGVKATRARFPNSAGSANEYDPFILREYSKTKKAFIFPTDQDVREKIDTEAESDLEDLLSGLDNESSIELHIGSTYNGHIARVESIEKDDEGKVFFRIPESDATQFYKVPSVNTRPFDLILENARVFLDEPGEWYLNKTENRVYYKLRNGENKSNIKVERPFLNTLINIDGASDLTFYGIVFENANWTQPSDIGKFGNQNFVFLSENENGRPYKEIPAAIEIRNSVRVHFERNIFRHTGGSGIQAFDDDNKHLTLVGNVFYRTAASALQLGDARSNGDINDPGTALFRPVVSNNYFFQVGNEYKTPVINAINPFQLTFINNELEDALAMGVHLGHGVNFADAQLFRPYIKQNKFLHIAREATDAAPFHTRNDSRGARIIENWFADTKKVVNGRILGRHKDAHNDPKFGGATFIDTDGEDTNVIRNVTTGYSYGDFPCSKESHCQHHIYGARGERNHVVDAFIAEKDGIKSSAGLETEYADIKTMLYNGSIGGEKSPGWRPFTTQIIDDYDFFENSNVNTDYLNASITYTGTWKRESFSYNESEGSYLGYHYETTERGATITIKFTGTGIDIFGPVRKNPARVKITLNDEDPQQISLKADRVRYQHTWYSVRGLTPKQHTLVIKNVRTDGYVGIDGVEVHRERNLWTRLED